MPDENVSRDLGWAVGPTDSTIYECGCMRGTCGDLLRTHFGPGPPFEPGDYCCDDAYAPNCDSQNHTCAGKWQECAGTRQECENWQNGTFQPNPSVKLVHVTTFQRNPVNQQCVPCGQNVPQKCGATRTTYTRPDCKTQEPMYSCTCLLYTSPSPRDRTRSRMPSSA